ncbi:MAG: 2Fe-2S iron-sulfur cluster-binding protein, partial [Thermocrispum sp.]
MADPVTSHLLTVSEVIRETGDACSVVFDVPTELAAAFDYRPGQFLTLRIPSDECGSVARCYSLSSSPYTDAALKVTVKRSVDGFASHWVNDTLAPGDTVQVLPPSGVFTPKSLEDDLLLFAGGSGITPVISIVKSAMAKGSGSLVLVYANRDAASVIFADELRELAQTHPERLVVVHWLESLQGLPTAERLRTLAEPFAERDAFVCGPPPYMKAARAALRELDFPRERVHVERFVSLTGNPFERAEPVEVDPDLEPAELTVDLDGQTRSLRWPRNQKLLDLLLENGLDAPFSCREGACSACACRIVAGEVTMIHN